MMGFDSPGFDLQEDDMDSAGFDLQDDSIDGGGGDGFQVSDAIDDQALHHDALSRCFGWGFVIVASLIAKFGKPRLQTLWLCKALLLSSCFSGIGALEVALAFVVSAVLRHGLECHIQTVSSCENVPLCRRLLSARNPSMHLFEDVLAHFPFAERVRGQDAKAIQTILGSHPVELTVPCSLHGRCFVREVHGDISGSPCTPFSSDGLRRGVRDPNIILFIAWCLLHRALGAILLVHENVLGFDDALLLDLLGASYDVFRIITEPAHVGFAVGSVQIYRI
ncbi:unnamed protein product [Polarella glacialis]|uniref:Uncharacterized protein n=1 Tax=Polarella glacialis TaxID=89957 RepID=A0A813HHR2_POLGL|nr:unnamed protein product [Polarella glacialis]